MRTLGLGHVSPLLERDLYVAAGRVVGTDRGGRPVRLDTPAVVVQIRREADGWLLVCRPLGAAAQAPGDADRATRPVAS